MDNYFDHIEDYIADRLSMENKELFESELSKNEDLSFAVQEYKLLQDVQHVLIEEDIQASINEVQTEIAGGSMPQQTVQSAKRIWLKPLSIAASVALLLGLGYFAMQGLDGSIAGNEIYAMTGVELHEKYFRAPVDDQERGENSDTVVTDLPQKPCNIAHQLMTELKYDEALDTFKYSLEDSEDICKWKSEFYTALIYAIIGEREQSKLELKPILENQKHGYYKKAKQLLLDLD